MYPEEDVGKLAYDVADGTMGADPNCVGILPTETALEFDTCLVYEVSVHTKVTY